jgi:hypothetical protein
MCRSLGTEIYDLAWSPDAAFFIIGSMDNVARIYNAGTGGWLDPLGMDSSRTFADRLHQGHLCARSPNTATTSRAWPGTH